MHFVRGLPTALCCDKNANRCGVTDDLGIVPAMKTIGMSPSFIAHHVSAATSESHLQVAVLHEGLRRSAIRCTAYHARAIPQSRCLPVACSASMPASSSSLTNRHRH